MTLCLAAVLYGCVPQPHTFLADPGAVTASADSTRQPGTSLRLAILPLVNYTSAGDAPERVVPILLAVLGGKPGLEIADAGAVEAVLEKEPWLLLDRLPPDLVDRIGPDLHVDALLVGSLLSYGYRDDGGDRIPQVSMTLRLVQTPGSRVLWSAVHSRDGADGEWLFGFGKVQSLEQLATDTVREVLTTFPVPKASGKNVAQRGR